MCTCACVNVHVFVCVLVHVYETGWENEPPGKQMLNVKYSLFHLFKTQIHVN